MVGQWNLVFVLGMRAGGFVAGWLFANPEPVAISQATHDALAGLGIQDFDGFVPDDLIGWRRSSPCPASR